MALSVQKLADQFSGVRGTLAAGVIAAPLMFGAFGTAANDARAHEIKISTVTEIEAGKIAGNAGEYADSGKGVAVVAFIGKRLLQKGYSAKQVAEAFEKKFAGLNVTAKVFAAHSPAENTSISFITKKTSYGPFGVGKALENIKTAANQYTVEKSLASLELPENSLSR